VSDELEGAELGEDPAAVRSYASGAPLGWVPPPFVIGDPDCIENGERFPLAVVPTLVSGFDIRCPESIGAPREPLDVRDRANWCFWSGILQQTYTDAAGAMEAVALALGVPAVGFSQESAVGLVPPFFILNSPAPNAIVVAIAGTTTALQWLAQINYGIGPPANMGMFGSNFVWYVISSNILNQMLSLGLDPDQRIIVVGHSLGGAVASLLCARLRLGNDTRTIQLLTCGSPSPGDERLIVLLRTLQIVTLQNDGDVVLNLPANLSDLPFLLALAFGPLFLGTTMFWESPPNRFRIAWDGVIEQGAAGPGPAEAVQVILLWAFLSGRAPDLSSHLPDEYFRRLCRPAPLGVAWLDAWDLNQRDGDAVAVWPNKVNATNSAEVIPTLDVPVFAEGVQGMLVAVEFAGTASVPEILTLTNPLPGSPTFSFYGVCQIVNPDPNHDTGNRFGVPWVGGSTFAPITTEWHGPATVTPGWRVRYGAGLVHVPWDGGVFCPALLSVYWDGHALSIRLETSTVETAVVSTSNPPLTWQFLGGDIPGTSAPPIIAVLIGETLYYADVLPSDHDGSVLEYLRTKWLTHRIGITTESGDALTTESGDALVTE
jgi:pimeloyl-ACP methyl ester carboxylesterase